MSSQRPTVVKVSKPNSKFLKDEIFGPFLAIYVYADEDFGEGLYKLIDETSAFALSGSVFANDRTVVDEATEALRFSAGNFYIK